MTFIAKYQSPLGGITLASDGTALTGLWFDGQKYFAASLCGCTEERCTPLFDETHRWLDIYFSGEAPGFTPPLNPGGTEFRKTVYRIMLSIPYGKTMTYGDIARVTAENMDLGRMSAQAVGGAVGHNPISIIIPCHRVVGSNGSLTGYAGGLEKKIRLLELEKADISKLFIPR